jgi:hypothetical protein
MNASTLTPRTGGFVAVNDIADKGVCGAVIYWSLRGTCTVNALTEALIAKGSAATPPEPPSDAVALHRAAIEVARARKLELRPIKRGWALCRPPFENASAPGSTAPAAICSLEYAVVATAKRDNKSLYFDGDVDTVAAWRSQRDIEAGALAPSDISSWLCAKLDGLHAIALRDHGGVYFVPRDSVSRWERVVAAVKSVSGHRLYSVPSMKSADAIEAILSALENATTTAIDAVAEAVGGGIGARALETKSRELDALVNRLGKYEALLGVKLDALRQKTSEAQQTVAVAALAAAADEEPSS